MTKVTGMDGIGTVLRIVSGAGTESATTTTTIMTAGKSEGIGVTSLSGEIFAGVYG